MLECNDDGVCELPSSKDKGKEGKVGVDMGIKIFYVTDPICSYCFAFEPLLRKFNFAYSHIFGRMEILMGGLLEKWEGFGDAGNAIRRPADVAPHWKEVGDRYGVPIDGSVWINDPLSSSYPPSQAFKIVEKYHADKAPSFLRKLRESLFAFNLNISKDEVIGNILKELSLDAADILSKAKGEGLELLKLDMKKSREMGATGFPSIVFTKGERVAKIGGVRDFKMYQSTLEEFVGSKIEALKPPPLAELFNLSKRIFFREIEVVYDLKAASIKEFIQKELPKDSYEIKSIIGREYVKRLG